MQTFRALAFIAQMYLAMVLMALWWLPVALAREDGAHRGVRAYCRYVRWSAAWMVGLRSEVRGEVPDGAVMVASKHQSFFDIIMLVSVLPKPRFIMKKELTHMPILGWFARRMGCVPVDRGKGREAVEKMLAGVMRNSDAPGQLVIYPQGTRVAPDAKLPYKAGTGILYDALGQACVPVAVNVGVFWPRIGIRRDPGLAVIEFLETIPKGLDRETFDARLERVIEEGSVRLMREAGWRPIEERA